MHIHIHTHVHVHIHIHVWAFLVTQMVKNLPAMQETQVWSLGQEDPLEKGIFTHSSILAWRIPRTEEPVRLQSIGLQRFAYDCTTNIFTFIYIYIYIHTHTYMHTLTYIYTHTQIHTHTHVYIHLFGCIGS